MNNIEPSNEEKKSVTRVVKLKKTEKLALVQHRTLRSNIRYTLNYGDTIIGRKDCDMPSQIEVSDDYMSKQSARISFSIEDGSCVYRFTLIKSTNPVFYNDKLMETDESVYMKYGDTFKLGKTVFKVVND